MSRLADLSSREKALLLVVLPLVLLVAGWRLAWVPLNEVRAAREAEIAGYRLVVEAAGHAGLRVGPDADAIPFAARVTQSADAAGLSLRRLEPEGERLRVSIEEASFAQVVLWISDLEEERDVLLAAIELDRRIVPGSVSARLLLEPAR